MKVRPPDKTAYLKIIFLLSSFLTQTCVLGAQKNHLISFYSYNWYYTVRSIVNKKSIPDWHLFITQMETKWTKWYAMTSHEIAYRSTELLFGMHTFNFNCFFEDFNSVFTQIRCLSRLLLERIFSFIKNLLFYHE